MGCQGQRKTGAFALSPREMKLVTRIQSIEMKKERAGKYTLGFMWWST